MLFSIPSLQKFYPIVVAALFVAGVAACSRPHATYLPLNLADIPKVQTQLDKLPADERELVLDYLRRSKGDVLPAKFADPDAPLTARTFGEAIKLQREFKAKRAVENAGIEARLGAREAAMEPLRQVLTVELVYREILTRDEVSGRQPGPGQAINDTPVLVTTYRLRNNSNETIAQASGSVTVRTVSDPASLMGVDRCFFNQLDPIPAGQSVEVRCGNPSKRAYLAEKEYVAMPVSALILRWEPKSITLAGGKVLKSAE